MTGIWNIVRSEWRALTGALDSGAQDGERLELEKLLGALVRQVPLAIVSNLALIILIVPIVLAGKERREFWIWAGSFSFLLVARSCTLWPGVARNLHSRSPSWICRRAVLYSFLTGSAWGLLPFVLDWSATSNVDSFVPFVLSGVSAGAIGSASSLILSYIAFTLPVVISLMLATWGAQPSWWVCFCFILCSFLVFMVRSCFVINATMRQVIQSAGEREKLVGDVDRSRSEVELKNRELDAALRAAKTAVVAKGEFLAKMSHEIRTPLNGILGMANLELERATDKESREAISIMRDSASQLLAIINDILDHSKIEAGKLLVESLPFDLSAELRKQERLYRTFAAQRGVKLRLDLSPVVPQYVMGDALRLGQILGNLLGNAVKFTPEGGEVALQVNLEREDLGIATLLFAVRDNGCGIPEDQQLSIFDAFVQADSSVTRKHGGTGLGLTISANLAALMGGAISLESKPGVGSKFTARLPFAVLREADFAQFKLKEVAASLPAPTQATPLLKRKIRILVAEDNLVNQKLASKMLSREGFEVRIAENGREAVDLANHEDFHIILMDCQMPIMDGYEATRLLRESKREGLASIPIVALTAHALAGDREKCLAVGMNEYVTKPFDRQKLIDTIYRLARA